MLKLPETMATPSDRSLAGLGRPLRLLPPPKVIEVTAADCWETEPVMKEGVVEGYQWGNHALRMSQVRTLRAADFGIDCAAGCDVDIHGQWHFPARTGRTGRTADEMRLMHAQAAQRLHALQDHVSLPVARRQLALAALAARNRRDPRERPDDAADAKALACWAEDGGGQRNLPLPPYE